MKIGIDARFLTHPQVGGFKTYTENLVNALGEIDHTNKYVIYLDRPPLAGILPKKDNFTYQVVSGTLPGLGMPLREQITLRRYIARDKPDIVHFPCNTAPVKMPEKFVVTLHDTIQVTSPQVFKLVRSLADHKRWAITAYSKWTIFKTIQAANKIITVSNFEKDQIVKELAVAPQRVCVTHLAPNPIFQPASLAKKKAWQAQIQQRLGVSGKFVLGVGYEARKNIPLLIEAFGQSASDHPDLNLVIVAAQEGNRLSFQQLVSERNLNNRAIILAALPPHDLAILYNLAAVFVFPSERESFGLPPLEALACGAPTVAMNMSSIPEILQDGAMLVSGKDVQTWAEAIKQVLTDVDLRKDLVTRGLQRAAKLTWQRCAQETLKVYQAVAEKT